MKVTVLIQGASIGKIFENVKSTYQKGDLFCVELEDNTIHKYPVATIVTVIEENNFQPDKDKKVIHG